jgi:hypothetical protein
MATLSDLRTYVAQDLRDVTFATFSQSEVDDLVNAGLDAVSDVYPRELVASLGTVSASVKSYSASSFQNIYRIDIYTSGGTYRLSVPVGVGDGPNSGWELHGGVLYFPPGITMQDGDTIRAFGYARYTQLSASSATTDLDSTGIKALRVFCQSEAFQLLLNDRALFAQWQGQPGNTDITGLALAQIAAAKTGRWEREKARIRRLRKRG